MPPECDPEAGEIKEGVVNGEQMLVTNQQSAKLPEPCIGSFHNPSALVAVDLADIVIAPQIVVVSVRCNQFDSSFLKPLAQRIGVVAAVGYDALRLLIPAVPDCSYRRGRRRPLPRRTTGQNEPITDACSQLGLIAIHARLTFTGDYLPSFRVPIPISIAVFLGNTTSFPRARKCE